MTLKRINLSFFYLLIPLSCFLSSHLAAKAKPAKIDPQVAEKLCTEGDLAACIRLATYYEKSDQTSLALPLYEKACYASDQVSCLKLAAAAKKQNKVAETMKWLRAECRSPSSSGEGCYQIALIAQDQGLKHETQRWMTKACRKGHDLACKAAK